jgi:predicted AlkP superfamily pyrophosphatase or phosphodiesterase
MTSIHTGVPPGEHGVVGWSQYHPRIDRVVEPIPARVRGGDPGDVTTALDLDALVTADPVYPELEARGVSTHVLQQTITLDSPYANRTLAGASTHPFVDVDDMAQTLRNTLEQTRLPAYVCVHLLDLDTAAHDHGTDSAAYQSVLARLCGALERELLDGGTVPERTLVLLTADHGHVDTDPDRAIALLDDPVVSEALATRADGTPLLPTGGPRNVHLHLRSDAIARVGDRLREQYDLDVVERRALDETGLLGPTLTESTRRRCGDLVVAHPTRSVWHGTDGPADRIGQHGWLSKREMLVPLVGAELSTLLR